MSLLDDIDGATDHQYRRPPAEYPAGWEPGITYDASKREGTVTSRPTGEPPDWNALLAEYLPPGWDSSLYEIDPDSVRFTAWDGWGRDRQGDDATSRKQYSFRARVIPKSTVTLSVDSELLNWIRKAKPRRPSHNGDTALVVGWADWQVGKPGTQQTVELLVDMIGKVEDRWRQLRKTGVNLSSLYVFGLGDLGEACSGHYPMQTYQAELNERDQRKLIRRAAVRALKDWAKLAPRIVVAPVGGNHGEVRANGKAFTDFADNRDVGVFEDVAEILAENDEAFGHITFAIPQADLTQTLDVHGTVVGIAHGHQFPRGRHASQAALDWWKGQMEGRQPIGDADILLSAHRHHLVVQRQGHRTFIQAPALDAGSEWFTNLTGLESPPGTLTFTVDPQGWDHLRVV